MKVKFAQLLERLGETRQLIALNQLKQSQSIRHRNIIIITIISWLQYHHEYCDVYLTEDHWRYVCDTKDPRQVEAGHLLNNTMLVLMPRSMKVATMMMAMLMITKKMVTMVKMKVTSKNMKVTSPTTSSVLGSLYLKEKIKLTHSLC